MRKRLTAIVIGLFMALSIAPAAHADIPCVLDLGRWCG
ncbi:MAG: hypothetical protein QOG54_755 [Actinomycetota bacterium]|jgi:hypothetical protein|nr:hypothetical protein [Actinomycetota bacterium]